MRGLIGDAIPVHVAGYGADSPDFGEVVADFLVEEQDWEQAGKVVDARVHWGIAAHGKCT